MAKGGIEAPSEAEIKELSEIAIPEKPSREEERLLGMCIRSHYIVLVRYGFSGYSDVISIFSSDMSPIFLTPTSMQLFI